MNQDKIEEVENNFSYVASKLLEVFGSRNLTADTCYYGDDDEGDKES